MKVSSFVLCLISTGFITALMLVPIQSNAHHAFASEFDFNKPVTHTGVVTMLKWINPHGRIQIDVKNENGDVVNWDFELQPVNILIRQGWKKSDLVLGDSVTISGHQAKDDRPVARATLIRLSNGELLYGDEGRNGTGDGSIGGVEPLE
jgi:hypothetical protein